MAFRIDAEECTACGLCMDVCPSDAIKEGDDYFEIDQDACDDCGSCVDECPSDAIIEE